MESSPTVWLLHVVDHFTRCSVSCVIRSKQKEVIAETILKHWIAIFGYSHPH